MDKRLAVSKFLMIYLLQLCYYCPCKYFFWLLVDPSAPQELPCGTTVSIADYEFGYVDLVSPGWPDGYSNNVRCDWTVTAEPGMVVKAEAIEWEINNDLSKTLKNLVVQAIGLQIV